MSQRANIRRERKYLAKLNGKKANKEVEAEKNVMQGILDGREYSACVVLRALHYKYGWGTKRLKEFLNYCGEECSKIDRDGISFVLRKYEKICQESLPRSIDFDKNQNIFRDIYLARLETAYCEVLAVQLMVLNDHYGFSSNSKKTGRLDFIIEYAGGQWEKIQTGVTVNHYKKETAQIIGFGV